MESKIAIDEQELCRLCKEGRCEEIGVALSSSKSTSNLSRAAINLFKELSQLGPEKRTAVTVAVLHILSDAELSKLRFWPVAFDNSILNSAVLKSVPKERLQFFAELLLKNETFMDIVDDLVSSGLIDKPWCSNYVAAYIAKCSWANKNRNGLADLLRSRPEFLADDVWMLFKYDGTAESSLSGADKYLTNAKESWQSVLVDFAKEGLLDRGRLLDESLRALGRDFNQFRASWFSRFHEALAPTMQERLERTKTYADLLNSPIPPTVSFAISMLGSIDKVSPIPLEVLKSSLPNALTAKSKQTALGAVKLLESCAQREPSLQKAVCLLACSALVSENAEVQTQAIRLINTFGEATDSELKQTLEDYLPGLSYSVRNKLPEWMRQHYSNQVETATSTSSNAQFERLLHTVRILAPIVDLDELVLKAAYVLEHPEAFCDYELVLDGILRNCARGQTDFKVKTSSLLQRARKLRTRTDEATIKQFCDLIIAWIADEPAPRKIYNEGQVQFKHLHQYRLQSITDRVQKRQPSPLLSLPSDGFGWLDARELLERINQGYVVFDDPWDICLAIMRLRNDTNTANIVHQLTRDSKHPALLYARSCHSTADQLSIDWSINRRTSTNNFLFTSINLTLDVSTIFGPVPPKDPERWFLLQNPSEQDVLLEGLYTPNRRQLYFAQGVEWLGNLMQFTDVRDKSSRFYLHFLRDPSSTPGIFGSLLLALSVSTGDHDISVAGIDCFIELIAQNRLDFEATADAMQKLFHAGDFIKANRWGKHLHSIAKASPKHSHQIYALIQHVLSSPLESQPRDLYYLLELLVELKAESGGCLQSPTAENLRSMKTTGKTRKLIEQLLG